MNNQHHHENKLYWANVAASVLLVLSLLQMAGFATGSRLLRGLGAASVLSPFPKVFCTADVQAGQGGGKVETFSSTFAIFFEDANGHPQSLELTPQTGHLLRGPYNRRNVYGAGLSYAPCLPRDLVDQILAYSFRSQDAPLRSEFGIPDDARNVRLVITNRDSGPQRRWEYPIDSVECGSSIASDWIPAAPHHID